MENTENKNKAAGAPSALNVGLADPLLMQDAMMVRMWRAREAGRGVRLSADEVWLLMSNALGNWNIEDSLTANIV